MGQETSFAAAVHRQTPDGRCLSGWFLANSAFRYGSADMDQNRNIMVTFLWIGTTAIPRHLDVHAATRNLQYAAKCGITSFSIFIYTPRFNQIKSNGLICFAAQVLGYCTRKVQERYKYKTSNYVNFRVFQC